MRIYIYEDNSCLGPRLNSRHLGDPGSRAPEEVLQVGVPGRETRVAGAVDKRRRPDHVPVTVAHAADGASAVSLRVQSSPILVRKTQSKWNCLVGPATFGRVKICAG